MKQKTRIPSAMKLLIYLRNGCAISFTSDAGALFDLQVFCSVGKINLRANEWPTFFEEQSAGDQTKQHQHANKQIEWLILAGRKRDRSSSA